nr:mobilization protein [Alistipes sp. An54]
MQHTIPNSELQILVPAQRGAGDPLPADACSLRIGHNYSRFIVKRLFAERFEVIRRDPSKVEFLIRLNDFYFQFQRVGNNYNQVVRAINSHFSNVSIPRQIAALEQHTRELKALSIEILNLTKQAEGWLRI